MYKQVKKYFSIAPWIFLLFVSYLSGQPSSKQLLAKFISEEIKIDGSLNEPAWAAANETDYFYQYFPFDTVRAKLPTTVRIVYDDQNLYISFKAIATGGNYIVSSLRRDFGGTTNDNISLLLDTFNDGTNAYFFGVTPYGVQREGLVSDGGSIFNNTWDVKWRAESKQFEDYYTVEIAIPFTSLKYQEGATSWRIRPYRWNLQTNELSTWVRVPQNQSLSNLAFMGELVFEKPLKASRTPFAFIPYLNTIVQKDYPNDISKSKLTVGADAKIAIGDGMNLDLTINPDFSNVEVDDIFTNLTRFELRLPEKRQFFIDNNDLFDNFGNTFNESRPFFSRRIGLARNKDGNLIQNQIVAGARLSGKLNENWRLGFLNIQTEEDLSNEIASNNNSMIALQRKIFKRSNIGVFLVNRETFGNYEFIKEEDRYNRVLGVDYNMASDDNTWTGKAYLHKSFQPNDNSGNLSTQATVTYNSRKWTLINDWVYVDKEFRADLGFVPRTDIFKTGNLVAHNFYPSKGLINKHGPSFLSLIYWRPDLDLRKTDHTNRFQYSFDFRDQSSLNMDFTNNYIFLTSPFDPTRTTGGEPIPGNLGYNFNQFNFEYESNNTRLLTYSLSSSIGEFFNGDRYSLGGVLGMRFQPRAQVSLGLTYDGIRLPEPYSNADLWLLTSKVDITFSKSLFWSSLLQYSNQRSNLGINSRLQWRFAPLSDLFLVYNDNYNTENFGPRFRSINLKFTYWLNI